MAKFRIRRKLYNDAQQEQQVAPTSNTGAELRSAAIGTLAPMAITAGVNAVQNASKGTKAALIGGALAAGLGYAANKGYLGAGAQKFTGNIINQGKNLLTRFKPQNQSQQTVQTTQQAQPAANFDKFTGKVTKEGYKNYKNLDPEAQKRIQQQNAERKQQKAQQKAAAKQKAQQNIQVNTSSAPVQNQNKQPQTVTLKRKTGNN